MARAHTHSSADAAEADASFHRAPFNATGNDMPARMDLLLEPGLRVRDRVVHAHEQIDDPVPSHRAVLDAVRDQDPARAELAMLDLLAKAVHDLDQVTRAGTPPGALTAGPRDRPVTAALRAISASRGPKPAPTVAGEGCSFSGRRAGVR
ncbi:FCD domain-containing protein [Streptomyces fungicidicus]|uniref:FCD domain-containing protein n=1 Tax=Streptomyces fungicidicus TaxID=68203 RepID=UPI0036CBD6D9